MAGIAYFPGVSGCINGLLGPWYSGIINGGVSLMNIAPWIGNLFRLTENAPEPIQDLHKELAILYSAANKNDFEAFVAAALEVENKIKTITSNPSKEIFKGYTYLEIINSPTSWDSYLKPLNDLQSQLEHFRTRAGFEEYNTDYLQDPLTSAVKFINNEIEKHAGVLNKTFNALADEAGKVIQQRMGEFSRDDRKECTVRLQLSPLQNIVNDIKKFRIGTHHYSPDDVSKTLFDDLAALERYHPYFTGINKYVSAGQPQKGGSLIEHLDAFLVEFIRLNIIPKIDGDAFHLAYYDSALSFDHVGRDYITQDIEKKKDWGREMTRPEEKIEESKEKNTLFSAVNYIFEIKYCEELNNHFPTEHESLNTLLKKVEATVDLLQKHPIIMSDPNFGSTIQNLITCYIRKANELLHFSFSQKLQDISIKNQTDPKDNCLQNLHDLKRILPTSSQHSGKVTSIFQKGLAALKNQTDQYGIPLPTTVTECVESALRTVDSQVEELIGRSEEEKKSSPFMNLKNNLSLYIAERAEKNETVIQKTLERNLQALEIAYPELQEITTFVNANRKDGPYIDVIKHLVTRFILTKMAEDHSPLRKLAERHGATFYQAFYTASKNQNLLKETEYRFNKADQITVGHSFYIKNKNNTAMLWKPLWEAVELILNIDQLEKTIDGLKLKEEPTLEEISRNIDVALIILSNPHIEKVNELLTLVYTQFPSYLNWIVEFSITTLNATDEKLVDVEVDKAQNFMNNNKPAEALKILKALFDTGPLLQNVGKIGHEESPTSAVAKLIADFETKHTDVERSLTPIVKQDDIQKEERILTHNLSIFSTFKVLSIYCNLNLKTSEEIFEKIFTKIEQYSYDGSPSQLQQKRKREKIFQEELNKMMSEFCHVNIGFLSWIVFKLVKHFTSQFSRSIVWSAQTEMLKYSKKPLGGGHYDIIYNINNGALALLFAERIWKQDATGQYGIDEKELKMIKILDHFDGSSQKKLIRQVVDKALNEFPITTVSRYPFLNGIASFFVKRMARLIIHHTQLITTILETMNTAIYSGKYINHSCDKILLKQIKDFEKNLGEENGEIVIKEEGDHAKRLVTQLVENLFTLLREQGEVPVDDLKRKEQSILDQLTGVMGKETDAIIKDVVRDLLVFGYEQLNKKEELKNQLLIDGLKATNRVLGPTKIVLLRELYNENPSVDTLSEAILVQMFENEYRPNRHPTGCVSLQECEAALQKKYHKTEQELHEVLARTLNKAVKDVVITQVKTHLKTPREIIFDYIEWFEKQFDPYSAYMQKNRSYTYAMKILCSMADEAPEEDRLVISNQINACHNTLLIQLKNRLNLLKIKESEDPSKFNLQIKKLYRITSCVVKNLTDINQVLINNDYKGTYPFLNQLEQQIKEFEEELTAIRMTLTQDRLSYSEQAKEMTFSIGRKGVEELAVPVVRTFLNRWITPLAEKSIGMYKSRAVFKAIIDQVIFKSYLQYQPPTREENMTEDLDTLTQNGTC